MPKVSKKCPSGPAPRLRPVLDLRGSRQSDSNRRPADCQSVAFLEGRYLGHDISVKMLRVSKELHRALQVETGQRQAPKSKEWLVELIKLGLNLPE